MSVTEATPAEANFANRTIFTGDNLPVLKGFNTGSVDLIYLDPPFNSKRNYAGTAGTQADGAAFKDIWTPEDVNPAWSEHIRESHPCLRHVIDAGRATGGEATMSYLTMMAVRLIEMRRVLKPSGSVYLHCDPNESHSLKLVMDCVFGRGNFRNEIVWCYSTGGASKQRFAPKHDIILLYTKTVSAVFNPSRVPYTSAMSQDPKHRHKFHPEGKLMLDWWDDIPPVNPLAKERTGYPTQKPVALLERVIAASSNPGDVVLDPFSGCATACVAAENLGRQWVGVDVSAKSIDLIRDRLSGHLGLFGDLVTHRTDVPVRSV